MLSANQFETGPLMQRMVRTTQKVPRFFFQFPQSLYMSYLGVTYYVGNEYLLWEPLNKNVFTLCELCKNFMIMLSSN